LGHSRYFLSLDHLNPVALLVDQQTILFAFNSLCMLIILSQFPILGHLGVQFSLVVKESIATLSHLSTLLFFKLSLSSHDLHELLTVLSSKLFDSGIVVSKLPLA